MPANARGTARVVGQWTYDAYGNVVSADHLFPHAYSRVGHKGLIFDRLDVGVADHGYSGSFTPGMFIGHNSTEFDTPRIVPFAKGIYHNRNRAYMPELGRFAQADPNASGMGLLDMPVHHGGGFSPHRIVFDIMRRYRDGGSLYGYLSPNPWDNSDSLGLQVAISGGGGASGATLTVGAFVAVMLIIQTDAYRAAVLAATFAFEDFASGSYDAAEALFQYAESRAIIISAFSFGGTVMAVTQSKALQQIYGQVDHINLHFDKLSDPAARPGGPKGPKRNGYLEELKAALKTVENKLKSLGGNTQKIWKAKLDEWIVRFVQEGGNWP